MVDVALVSVVLQASRQTRGKAQALVDLAQQKSTTSFSTATGFLGRTESAAP